MRFHAFPLLSLCLILAGCGGTYNAPPAKPSPGVKLSGSVHGGQQPIIGRHVYLFAANTTGYGQPSLSLLNASVTGLSDSIGAYVTTDSQGGFTITGDYSCTPNTQVYLYSLGGNPGAGVNSGAGLLAALGNCPSSGSFLATVPFISVNEVTTVAAAYAIAGFATTAVAVDGAGNIWVANIGATISEFSNNGVAISPSTGYSLGPHYLNAIAVDGSGNVWVTTDAAVVVFVGAATPVVTPIATGVKNNTLGTRP